jgi:Mrp family chromosome partitioning ATPase
MGLMLEALKHLEGNVALPSTHFAFPAVPQSPAIEPTAVVLPPQPNREQPTVEQPSFEPASMPPSNVLHWPELNDPAMAEVYGKIADRMLRQLATEAQREQPLSEMEIALPTDTLGRPMVLAFTSPDNGGGTTGLLVDLAPQLASLFSDRVLIVDANFEKPDLSARLGAPASRRWGLSCAGLLGATVQHSPEKEIDPPTTIYSTDRQHLSFLPAAWTDEDVRQPAVLAAWIDTLRADWPLVLVDVPSMIHNDAAPLARCCDGVYLVVRLGSTARRTLIDAAATIRVKGGRVLGCLVIQ